VQVWGLLKVLRFKKTESKEICTRRVPGTPWYALARQAVLACAEPCCGELRVPHSADLQFLRLLRLIKNAGLLGDVDDLAFALRGV